MVTALDFLDGSVGLMKCPVQTNKGGGGAGWGGGAFLWNRRQMLQGAEWVVREVSLDFLITRFTSLILGTPVLLFAQMFVQVVKPATTVS